MKFLFKSNIIQKFYHSIEQYMLFHRLKEKLSNFNDLKTKYTLYEYTMCARYIFSHSVNETYHRLNMYSRVNNTHMREKEFSNLLCLLTVKNNQNFQQKLKKKLVARGEREWKLTLNKVAKCIIYICLFALLNRLTD